MKKGDELRIENKSPTSLLTVSYKICTKVFQLRLIWVLNKVISAQQYAYLLGRSIHHTVLLTNEMVSQALAETDPYVCLKLNVVKAFDSVEWFFIENGEVGLWWGFY